MNILVYHPSNEALAVWLRGMRLRLPNAAVRPWQQGDREKAEYAIVRKPPLELLHAREGLKAVFSMAAGVDDIMDLLRAHPDALPATVPLFRLEDAGMARQMQEYAVYAALGWYRRFAAYKSQQAHAEWKPLDVAPRKAFVIGILGAGVLGRAVAEALLPWDFSLRCWSRSPKQFASVSSFHGPGQMDSFLNGVNVLVNLLPATPATEGIINRSLLARLAPGALVVNMARGAHVVEADLLAALDAGEIGGAVLDAFVREPLPKDHPFWSDSRIAITPHVAAQTLPDESMDIIARAICELESGNMPSGRVNMNAGY